MTGGAGAIEPVSRLPEGGELSLGVEVLFPTNGRRVRLEELHVIPTRADWVEVNRRREMLDRIPGLVAKLFGPEFPFVIRNPDRDHLPRTCLCLFASDPLTRYGVTIEDSWLVVCWFTHEVSGSVRQLVCEGLSELDWEANAKDFRTDF